MRYTLLEMVQLILSSMDGEEVNNISDTVESNQVALVIKSVYYDMLSDIALPNTESLIQLEASIDPLKPCLMTIPTDAYKIYSIMYDNKLSTETYSNYQPVVFKEFSEFVQDQQGLREDLTEVGSMAIVIDGQTYNVLYAKDRMPAYYTTVGDNTILFDSYLSTEDTTLQKSKTLCKGLRVPSFSLTNTFVPDLDPTQFSYLVNRAKVRAFNEIKQQVNSEAGGEARRQKIMIQKHKRKTPDAPAEVYRVSSRFGRKN